MRQNHVWCTVQTHRSSVLPGREQFAKTCSDKEEMMTGLIWSCQTALLMLQDSFFGVGADQAQELKKVIWERTVKLCTCAPCAGAALLFPWFALFQWVFTSPSPGHHHFTSTICWRQMQRGWFSGWFNVLYSPWKQNSFPGRATLKSQQGDMKQSQACDALPQYPLPFHSHILRFYRESIFPLPPLWGNSIWNFTSPPSRPLSLSLVSSSHDGWAPHSGVSQPVHHALRLGIKNCKRFTIANPIFLPLPPPRASPQPRL